MQGLPREIPRTITSKLLLIGLDGVTFDSLDQLMADGRCPALSALIREGVRSELLTTFPPITAVAWTSLATGKNPGKHGIFEFILAREGGRRPIAAHAGARDGEALWEMVSRSGRRVIVTNFPCTYPPCELNGLMIADFMTPPGRRDFTYPRGLLEEIERRHGPYRLTLKQTYAPGGIDAVLDELLDELHYKTQVNCDLMQRYPWDVFITHIWGTDRIQHELWHVVDPDHPRHQPEESLAYRERVQQYWEEVDRQVERMVSSAGPSTSVWIVSDHGFGPVHKFCSFNLWLLQQGFLFLRRDAVTRLKKLLFDLGLTPEFAYRASRHPLFKRLRPSRGVSTRPGAAALLSRLFLSFHDVDWSRTTAYSKGNYGQIFINLKGREPQGTIAPGGEYAGIRDQIVKRLWETKTPESGEKLIGSVWTSDELYQGPHLRAAPDVCFLPKDMRYLAQGNTDFNSRRFITDAFTNSGSHRMNGVLIARGEVLKHGFDLGRTHIYNLAPTLLHQLDLAIPNDLDGDVIREMFNPQWIEAHAPRTRPPADPRAYQPAIELSPEEQAEIEARLKNLGYLG